MNELKQLQQPRNNTKITFTPLSWPGLITPNSYTQLAAKMATQTATETKTHNEYTVGWVCALTKEQTAATAMLDQRHGNLPKPANDSNTYTLGSVRGHNVVIACLPKGQIGNNSAATVAAHMVSTFPSIRFGLMVGIGGGVPPKVKLGDVVVSTPTDKYPGVVQWDFGKARDGSFERTGSLNNSPTLLLTALTALETEHDMVGTKIPEYLDDLKQKWPRLATKYLKSDSMVDVLFKADYNHVGESIADNHASSDNYYENEEEESCRHCDKTKVIKRKPEEMRVHYGLIASGNQVIKSAAHRDKLSKDLGGHLLCIEMEAAGLMNNFPCVIIRGICDYADSHKNKDWQEYAATVAAAFAKELLHHVQPSDVDRERTVKDMLGNVLTNISATRADVSYIKSNLVNDKDLQILEWMTSINYGPQHSDSLKRREPGTGQWLLDSTDYQTWLGSRKQTLFCPGIPGAGKTILTSIVVDHVEKTFEADATIGIAYIYCNYRRQEEQVIENLLASVLKQLCQGQDSLPDCVMNMYDQHKAKQTRPSVGEILVALRSVAMMFSRVFIIVDALDECQYAYGCRQTFLTELFNLQEKCEVNLLMTSRFIPEIVDRFKTVGKSLEIRASIEDVERYLKGHINQLPTFIQQNQELQQQIITGISEAVDGMFLLAQIYFNSLSDKLTTKAITIALKGFQKLAPGSNEVKRVEVLAHAYDQAMLRINGQQPGFKVLANKVLLWILLAERRLTKTELQHALAVEVDELKLDEDNLPSLQDMVSVCAGLVTIDDESNNIRLVHYTTQEYFNETRQRWFPDAEIIMADICAAYLLFNAFESGSCREEFDYEDINFKERLKLNPLYDYAAQNWGYHARKASGLCRKVMEFLECEAKMEASMDVLLFYDEKQDGDMRFIWYGRRDNVGQMTSLHLAAYFGIEEIIKALLEKTTNVDSRDYNRATVLLWSARNGHEAVVKILLAVPSVEVNCKDSKHGMTPLLWAVKNGHEAVVNLLLSMPNIEVNLTEFSGRTPLSFAAGNGHEAVVKLLLAMPNIEVNLTKLRDKTPLSFAAENGHEAVVKLLLAMPSIDIHSGGTDDALGSAPLLVAAHHGHGAVVTLLFEAGANPNLRLKGGKALLHRAARAGPPAIVKLLLAAGADPNPRGNGGRTPLHLAAWWKREDVVQLLLAAGSNPNLSDKNGRTPLCMAADPEPESSALSPRILRRYLDKPEVVEAVVKPLLAAGADPNFRDKLGQTPVSIAQKNGYEAVVELMLDNSANVYVADKDRKKGRAVKNSRTRGRGKHGKTK